MSIDWFTVVAQILNFGILVLLLQKYLYKPVLDAVKAREKNIADQMASAAALESSAEQKKKEYEEKNRQLEQDTTTLLDQAKKGAGEEKERLLAEARNTVESQRKQWMQGLTQQQQLLEKEWMQRTQSTVLDIVQKCLQDLADSRLQQQMTAAFIRSMNSLPPEEKQPLITAMRNTAETTLIAARSLSVEHQAALSKAISDLRGAATPPIRFETDPNLLCGIGLYVDGYKLEWTLAGYLQTVRTLASETLLNNG